MVYFTLEELSRSPTAAKLGIVNEPDYTQKRNLEILVKFTLDPLRKMFGKPIRVNSGFRCKELNDRLANSSLTSYHLLGRAADIRPMNLDDLPCLWDLCKTVPYIELIKYSNFIHIAL